MAPSRSPSCFEPASAILRPMSIRKAGGDWEPMLLGIEPRICKVCQQRLYRDKTMFRGGWSRCTVCDEFVHYSCLASGKVSFLKRPRICKSCRTAEEQARQAVPCPANPRPSGQHRSFWIPSSSTRPAWHVFFPTRFGMSWRRYCSSRWIFTANFIMAAITPGPATSRVFVLTLTLLILAYEFIYKDRTIQSSTPIGHSMPRAVFLYDPHALGVLMMLALAKL